MEKTLTVEQFNSLPKDVKAAYRFNNGEYVLQKDNSEVLKLIVLLYFLSQQVGTVSTTAKVVAKRLTKAEIIERMKLFSIRYALELSKTTKELLETNPTKEVILRFMEAKRLEINKINSIVTNIARIASNAPTADSIRLRSPQISQAAYFNQYMRQVEDGTHELKPNRIRMYGTATYTVFENVDRMITQGFVTAERRFLGFAEHCQDCINEAAKKWQLPGTLREIGDSQCLSNCRCHFEYKTEPQTELRELAVSS